MTVARHAIRLFVRNGRRSITAMVGTALAAGLLSSVLLFGAASGTTVTRRALADVQVDAQVVLEPGVAAADALAAVAADPAVRTVLPFDLVHVDSAELAKTGSATQTSSGVIVGIGPDYTNKTGLFGIVSGQLRSKSIAVSRDLASNLGAVSGDQVTFHLPGGATISLPVSGVIDTSGADLVLGPLDAGHRAAGANPPANVAVMPIADLEALVFPKVPLGAVATDPAANGTAAAPVFAPEPAVRREVDVQIDHAQVPGNPLMAQPWLDLVRHRLDRAGAGSFRTVDDAQAALEPLAADLAWGQILFLFLALPGILLAVSLVRLAADATQDSTRRHAALLRARGATVGELTVVFAVSTLLATFLGAVAGVALGTAMAEVLFGGALVAAGGPGEIALIAGWSVVGATLLGGITAGLSLRSGLKGEIAAGRSELVRVRRPIWQRLRIDVLLLAAGVAVYFLTANGGVHPVVGAEGNPTVTLALSAFVGPLLIWVGGTLLLLRIAISLAGRGTVRRILGRLAGPPGDLAGASLQARATTVAPVVVVVALAVGFATSVLLFDATYRQQQLVDARLTLGADLKAVPEAAATTDAARQAAGPGVLAATGFVDRIVYVGPEAQDLLAIDPAVLPTVAPLADSFFSGISATDAMAALRAQPDGILVSAETAKDYSIVAGDRVRIRVPDATGVLRQVDFKMVGIALEFPTAPKDAFLVANLDYVARQTANDRISFVLASADGEPGAGSGRLTTRLGGGWTVTDVSTTSARLANEITSVDLADLAWIDVSFAVLIGGVGIALFLLAGLADRRRELATLVAIGAEPAQVRIGLAAEAAAITFAGIAIGIVAGAVVGLSLLQVLSGVFDPAPDHPAIPVTPIFAFVVLVAAGATLAIGGAAGALNRLDVMSALRER
ncbi:MAG: FtsX-like permease family protein [Chloroflexi bacterium]|nr:FtsX-like permease family protein [Chloroflexota bacterium]